MNNQQVVKQLGVSKQVRMTLKLAASWAGTVRVVR